MLFLIWYLIKLEFYRGMAVNMVMMFGRIGVIIGNLFLPIIAEISCELSFFSLAQFHFGKKIK